MRKTILFIVSCMIITFFSGCSSNQKNYVKETIKNIITASDKDDADALVELFGNNIVEKNENLVAEAENFVAQIDGKFVSYDVKYEEESSSSRDHDGIKTQILVVAEVETSSEKYVIEMIANSAVYDENLKGIQSLGIQKLDDYNEEPCFASDYGGIYVVTSENHDEIIKLEEESYHPTLSTLQKRILEEAGVEADSFDDLTDQQKADLEAMEEMLAYAQNKYNKTFHYAGYIEPNNTELQEEEMILYASDNSLYPNEFSVKREGDGFTDNYMCVAVGDKTEAYIRDAVSELAEGATVKVYADISDTTITDLNFTAEDIAGNVIASCMIFIDGADLSGEVIASLPEKIQSWFVDQQIYGINQVIVLKEGEIDLISRTYYADALSEEHYLLRADCNAQE